LRPKIEHIGEFEEEFKKALAHELVAQGVLFDEKTKGRKSRDSVPLKRLKPFIILILLHTVVVNKFV
jgi:hypothetical protein